jgi:hypothetical protein
VQRPFATIDYALWHAQAVLEPQKRIARRGARPADRQGRDSDHTEGVARCCLNVFKVLRASEIWPLF